MYELNKSQLICDKPVFSWWVPYTLSKLGVIVLAIKNHISDITNKCFISILIIFDHEYNTNENNNNIFYRDSTENKVHNNGISLEMLGYDTIPPLGW